MDLPRDSELPSDLSPLAWVQEELRRSLESVHKTLRRFLRDGNESRLGNLGVEAQPSQALQAAAAQLHQVAGVVALVGLPAGATVLRAAETAVLKLAQQPLSIDSRAVETIERADFALLSYVARLLAGNKTGGLSLFAPYRELQTFNEAERIHPADLWQQDFSWRQLPADAQARPQSPEAARTSFEATLLKQMRNPRPEHAAALSDLCAGLAAAHGQTASRTLWQLAAAQFEAQAQGLLKQDVYVKRLGSRLLAQLRAGAAASPSQRLALDLLFFCAQSQPNAQTPRLQAVHDAWGLGGELPADYEDDSLGRIDPSWVTQAKRRVSQAKESWSSAAEGESHRLAGLDEQFAGVADSLARLFPSGEVLGQTLQRAVVSTLRSGRPPRPDLAMEIATCLLYVEAALEDAAFDQPEQAQRVRELARRVEAVGHGEAPEPLQAWMEELYRRVSDRQTLGSVVHELRASLSEVERQADEYFRNPAKREVLIPVPGQLQAMRGVLTVLGLDQAALATVRMRDEVDQLANTEVDPDREGPRGAFERLANNLGALGFLIDMLSVQPALAKRMFRFDEASGRLDAVMGRHEDAVSLPLRETQVMPLEEPSSLLSQVQAAAQAAADGERPAEELARDLERLSQQARAADDAAVAAAAQSAQRLLDGDQAEGARAQAAESLNQFLDARAPAAAPPVPAPAEEQVLDEDMREIFLEEAQEVIATARAALQALEQDPQDREQLTTVRRAFHTLKGSSRMVGLNQFGEGAWACEQLYNARLGEQLGADPALLAFSGEALDYLADWTDAIAARQASPHQPDGLRQSADALRLEGRVVPLDWPISGAMPLAAPMPEAAVAGAPDLAELPEPTVIELGAPAEAAEEPAAEPTVAPAIEALAIEALPEAAEVQEATELMPIDAVDDASSAPQVEVSEITLDEGFVLDLPAEPLPVAKTLLADAELPEFELRLDLGEPTVLPAAAPEPEAAPDVETIAAASEDLAALSAVLELSEAEASEVLPEPESESLAIPELTEQIVELQPEAAKPAVAGGPPVLTLVVDHGADGAAPQVSDEAGAEPSPAASDAAQDGEDGIKVIGPLRISITLFNIFLNEADELSRRLATDLAEWALELSVPVPGNCEARAHALAGSSATVGYEDLSQLARALEHALGRAQQAGSYQAADAELFTTAADEIRRLLHQFAAGFLKPVDPTLVEALQAYMPVLPEPVDSRLDLDADSTPAALPDLHQAQPGPVGADDAIFLTGAPDQIEAELFPIFEEEALDLLQDLQGSLRDWAAQPQDRSRAAAAMRALHTFKGGARLAGALRLGEEAHLLESAIERLLTQESWQASDVALLQDRCDALEVSFEALRERQRAPQPLAAAAVPAAAPVQPQPQPVDEAEALAEAAAAERPTELPAETPAAAEPEALPVALVPEALLEPLAGLAVDSGKRIDWRRFSQAAAAAATTVEEASPVAASQAIVRVRGALLERMATQAGEVSMRRARMESELSQMKTALVDLDDNLERLRTQMRELEVQAEAQLGATQEAAKLAGREFDPLEFDRYTRFQELTRMLAESVNDVGTVQRALTRSVQSGEDELAAQSRLTRELQDDLLRTRMVEFDSLAERLHRVVRQAAREAGKQVQLDISGGHIELDRSVLERLTGAFEHLLRNSVSHGIETPEQRRAAGKPELGTIKLRLAQEGNEVLLSFSDDGAGLDLARIRERGEKLGLLTQGAEVEDKRLMELIFAPGFSTASQVTELAGRGVGMDVVRAEVSTLGGYVDTSSVAGQGAGFDLRVPLTTALTQIVLLRYGELSVAVPASLMEAVRRVPLADVERAYASGELELLGEKLPFYWLGGLLHHSGQGLLQGRNLSVVVVKSAHQRVAVHVDEVIGNQEVVVKNLGPQLSGVPGLAGISLLASGEVALIYNPVVLSQWYGASAQLHGKHGAAEAHSPDEAPEVLPPLVLVVDDSLTVRRVTQRLLEREGYRVQLAKDGLDAMEKLAADELPGVVLSDIEMPRMDGFDLVRNMRADARLRALPVIMITSRIAQKHRDYAQELGVDHYLGKPYDEELLLSLIDQYTAEPLAVD